MVLAAAGQVPTEPLAIHLSPLATVVALVVLAMLGVTAAGQPA